MVHARRLSALCGLLAFCSLAIPRANADPLTQSGKFQTDNDVVQIDFSTTTVQTYTFDTTSYAGGVNADGTTTAAGGFDPVLTLFTSAGNFVPNGVGGGGSNCTGVGTDAGTGLCEDAFFTETLNPGSYILALTEFPNYSNGTITGADGFNPDNASEIASICGTTSSFEDANSCNIASPSASQRNGNYTVNITSSAVTPEPPSALLVLLPLAGVVFLNRRRLASIASL